MSDAVVRTVGALLVDRQGRVLLGLRSPHKKAWPDHWDSIGGKVEAGEAPEQAMIREVKEEVAVDVGTSRRSTRSPSPAPISTEGRCPPSTL
jgi:8-oxo-dGTP pyrophosphatase MutT (NUDIX family)